MQRRRLLQAGAAGALWPAAATANAPATPVPGTLRVAFNTAETGFDPPRTSDANAIRVLSHIFESPLTYDHLARPAKLVPQTAAALPEVSEDSRRFVFTIRPGILFGDDPAFGGRARELTAADYVYSVKRYYDPATRSEHLYQFENLGLLGLSELRRQALAARTPFPYDVEVPGLRALDRYRFEVRVPRPAPRLPHLFANPSYTGAVAREVVQAWPDDPGAHPVGTGPFQLLQWRRSSRTVLARNPRFREQVYAAEPPADDPAAQAVAAELRGRRLPLLERVEIDVVEETQPRWLAFLGGEHDIATPLPSDFAPLAVPGGRLAPFLERRGVQLHRYLQASTQHTFFNFDDPVVGGYDATQVALRRAVSLAFDSQAEIDRVLQGQAVRAHAMTAPHCYGHDAALRGEAGSGDVARAAALLDLYGFADRNGDGWRERPDGSPLELRLATSATQRGRAQSEIWRKSMAAVGLRMRFEPATFGELIKRALAGQLQMWGYIWGAQSPDADFWLGLAYGPNSEQSNDARFRLPAFDRLYERQHQLPDGPERLAAIRDATLTMLAWSPYIAHNHPVANDLAHPHVGGHRRHPFLSDAWRYTMIRGV